MIHLTQNLCNAVLTTWQFLSTFFLAHLWLIPVEIIALAALAIATMLRIQADELQRDLDSRRSAQQEG